MKKIFLISIIIFSLFFVLDTINAQSSQSVFPIVELGSCKDQQDCKVFCDQPDNMLKCVDYAVNNGMMSKEDADLAKKVIPKINANQTPGKCKTKQECESYCKTDALHISECVSFAEELNLLLPGELDQAKKVVKALEAGATLPGNCTDKNSCENYCQDTSHIEECLSFAEQSQILPASEIEEARKVMVFLKNGETPGKCKTKQECDAFCQNDSNFSECVSFAEKAGFISAEDAAMAKKVGGKGPGGCKSKEECAAYCNKEDNSEECTNFAIEKGLISDEDQQKMKEGASQIKAGLEQIPVDARGEVESCLVEVLGADKLTKIKNGEAISFTQSQGNKIEPCFTGVMANYAKKAAEQAGKEAMEQAQKNIPSSPPSGTGAPTNIPKMPVNTNVPPPDYKPDAATCARFAAAPSCDYVPESVRSMCQQCKK